MGTLYTRVCYGDHPIKKWRFCFILFYFLEVNAIGPLEWEPSVPGRQKTNRILDPKQRRGLALCPSVALSLSKEPRHVSTPSALPFPLRVSSRLAPAGRLAAELRLPHLQWHRLP